ncbi:MAG: Asp-tRNA(Asn)/Glu-tRNA(Gln) amidotransferase subunit GatC [Elusimicrobia bacterium]|nr:Asp-tRNA(Asn)/Glu-tRNA(Gln) amidotransferase subunit GatC [Elusimicrobiota bacterium]
MSVSEADVRRIAKLARLRLSDEEVRLYGGQLSKILDAMAELGRLDAAAVPADAPAASGALREDEPRPFAGRESLLANAPERDGPYVKVPRVIE